jgi:RNA polymerase sigma-70 factor (ECF subfamily)
MRLDDHLCQDFEQRLRPHGPVLLRFLRRMLARPSRAPDVLQAALTKAFEAHPRYDPETSFKAWIYRFATHEALNSNRRDRREVSMLSGEDSVEEGIAEANLELELAYEEVLANPEATLGRLDSPLAVALEELPTQERTAFLLRSLADFDCREIGSLMGAPKGTVVSWLFRARKRLRRRLAGYARSLGFREVE